LSPTTRASPPSRLPAPSPEGGQRHDAVRMSPTGVINAADPTDRSDRDDTEHRRRRAAPHSALGSRPGRHGSGRLSERGGDRRSVRDGRAYTAVPAGTASRRPGPPLTPAPVDGAEGEISPARQSRPRDAGSEHRRCYRCRLRARIPRRHPLVAAADARHYASADAASTPSP
jgi:hypothetical protein